MSQEPLNRGVAYDDMTPAQKQEYHARIVASRIPGQNGLTAIAQIIEKMPVAEVLCKAIR